MLSRWNSLVQRYARDGFYRKSLNLYYVMLKSDQPPNNFTFPLVIKSCAYLGLLNDGKKIHAHSVCMGLEGDLYVQTALVDMYGKLGDLVSARHVFDKMPNRSIASWNAMINVYCKVGEFLLALGFFNGLLVGNLRPTLSTLVSITAGCGQSELPEIGMSIHCYGVKLGLDLDSVVSCFLDYHHWWVHKDWKFSSGLQALLPNASRGARPDSVTFINLLSGCNYLESALVGNSLHASIIKSGCEYDDSIMTALVSMYMKFHDKNSSRKIFDIRSDKSVFLWTSMITGYVQNGEPNAALVLFQKMLTSCTKPNEITISSALSASAQLVSLATGRWIEEYLCSSGIEMSIRIVTALINMYCKCGSIEDARRLFDGSPNRDLTLWSSMIAGYAIHGKGKEAIDLLSEMIKEGVRPDDVAFAGILTACCHSGSVKDGLHYFSCMKNDFNIEPKLVHYSCLIDLLSRAGYLDEAWKIIQEAPHDNCGVLMAPLLSACRIHPNIGLAETAHVFIDHEPSGGGSYILLSNIYAAAGKWDMAASTRRLIQEKKLVKEAGCSKIELDNEA